MRRSQFSILKDVRFGHLSLPFDCAQDERQPGTLIFIVGRFFARRTKKRPTNLSPQPPSPGCLLVHWVPSSERYASIDCAKRRSTALGSCSSHAAIWLACSPG